MDFEIIPLVPAQHLDDVVTLSLAEWDPVFKSMAEDMEEGVFNAFYPDGWRVAQEQGVRQVCTDEAVESWVAVMPDGQVAGFCALKIPDDKVMGEIWMVATAPAHQGKGIGRTLTAHATQRLKDAGCQIAMVETGGDPGHAPARATYQASGYRLWTVARYFQKL
ncbi:MAG: GNAT family N-acetyltransferase [Alphaproteobacteria bacterium]